MKRTIFIIMILAALSAWSQTDTSTTKIIAHRGYWDTHGSAQNSIRALVKADSIGCWGCELDVWLTADSVLVVNHDPSIDGITIQDSCYDSLRHIRLRNGEPLPTLQQYLDTAATLAINLVLELKPHSSPEREALAADMIMAMIKERKLAERTTYISFSNFAVSYFAQHSNCPVYALSALPPEDLRDLGATGADYNLKALRTHPEWVEEFKASGTPINAWTVNDPADLEWCIAQGFSFITTNNPVTALSLAE